MRALSLGLTLAFGLGWLGTVAAEMALPLLLSDMPGLAGPAARTALDWAGTQATMAMGLSVAAFLAYAAGARGWGHAALLAILPLLALAVVQFDPRITAQGQALLGPVFNDLRAGQPLIRLGLFAGVALVAAAHAMTGGAGWGARAVALGVIAAWVGLAVLGAPRGAAVLMLPAALLLLITALILAEEDRPTAPYVLAGVAALLAGGMLVLQGASPRVDLRPAFAALVLLAAMAHLRPPALPQAVFWGHAALGLLGMAYLAPGLQQLGDVRPALSLAEMGAVIARAEALRGGVSLLMGLWLLAGIVLLRWRPRQPRPAPAPGATQG